MSGLCSIEWRLAFERRLNLYSDAMNVRNDSRDLLFLCSGNVLRSAFCELYARHLELPNRVRSAATEYRNRAIFPESRAALSALGVPANLLNAFRPTHIDDFDAPPAPNTLVYGMTRAHLASFTQSFGASFETRLILSVLGKDREVDDPYFTHRYAETFATLTDCIEAL